MNFKKIALLCFVLTFMCCSVAFAGSLASDEGLKNDVSAINETPLVFTDEQMQKLPKQAQEHILNSEGMLVESVATIYIVQKTEKGLNSFKYADYNFRNKEDVDKFNNDIDLDADILAAEIKGDISPLSQVDYGIMVVGLNVDFYRNGDYNRNFHLHGWWDWKSGFYVSRFDKVTLSWSHRLKSNSTTQRCYVNWKADGSSATLPKQTYDTERAIIWNHDKAALSSGAAVAHVGHDTIYNTTATLNFRYAANHQPASGYNISNFLCYFTGIPAPGPLYFDVSVDRYMPQ